MALQGDAGAAGGIDGDGLLWVECLEEQIVGYDADVGTEPDQFDCVIVREHGGECGRAEGGLFDDGGRLPYKGLEDIRDLPPCRAADAVLDGKLFPLLRLEIVRTVGEAAMVKTSTVPLACSAVSFAAIRGSIACASGVPSAPSIKSFCISTATRTLRISFSSITLLIFTDYRCMIKSIVFLKDKGYSHYEYKRFPTASYPMQITS